LAQDVIEIITLFSARRCGSRSYKTKRVLNELNAKGDSGAERSDEAVRGLLAAMEDAQKRAMPLYAKLQQARDASGS